jgi:hypothetical protein
VYGSALRGNELASEEGEAEEGGGVFEEKKEKKGFKIGQVIELPPEMVGIRREGPKHPNERFRVREIIDGGKHVKLDYIGKADEKGEKG